MEEKVKGPLLFCPPFTPRDSFGLFFHRQWCDTKAIPFFSSSFLVFSSPRFHTGGVDNLSALVHTTTGGSDQ